MREHGHGHGREHEKAPGMTRGLGCAACGSERAAQKPEGERRHCRYLAVAKGRNAVHPVGHPINVSTSVTVGHKPSAVNI